MKPALLLIFLAAASCSTPARPPLPVAKGPWQAMNAGRWGTGENDLIRPAPGAAQAVAR